MIEGAPHSDYDAEQDQDDYERGTSQEENRHSVAGCTECEEEDSKRHQPSEVSARISLIPQIGAHHNRDYVLKSGEDRDGLEGDAVEGIVNRVHQGNDSANPIVDEMHYGGRCEALLSVVQVMRVSPR